jgi:hypothetical protein
LAGTINDVDFNAVRYLREAQNWVTCPIAAGRASFIEGGFLDKRPAGGLDDAAFDLIAYAIRVDRFAAIDRSDGAHDPDQSAIARNLDLHRYGGIGAEVLEARKAVLQGTDFSADTLRLVKRNSFAIARPTIRGKRWVAPTAPLKASGH